MKYWGMVLYCMQELHRTVLASCNVAAVPEAAIGRPAVLRSLVVASTTYIRNILRIHTKCMHQVR